MTCRSYGFSPVVLRRQTSQDESFNGLVALQSGNAFLPFFCVPPAGGYAFRYADLARHIGANQPFYALDISEVVETEGYTSMEALAEHCVAAVQALQSQGPYLLSGWSFGGVVAFEMAQQLQRQGHEVALLAIIDSNIPIASLYPDEPGVELDISEAALADTAMRLIHMANPRQDFYQYTPQEQFACVYEQAKIVNFIPADVEPQVFRRIMVTHRIHAYAAHTYIPQVYSQRITLFRAMEDEQANDEQARSKEELTRLSPTRGWEQLTTGGIEVYPVPGNHHQIVEEPYVQVLAAELKKCIDEVRKTDVYQRSRGINAC